MRTLRCVWQSLVVAATLEFRRAARSPGVLLVLTGGVLLYGFLYNMLYAPSQVTDAPVVVADMSQTDLSRRYAIMVDAAPEVAVVATTPNLAEARQMVRRGSAVGMVVLPSDFEQRVGRGEQGWVLSVGATTNFLDYEALQTAATGAMLALDNRVRPSVVAFLPADSRTALTRPAAVSVVGEALYNPSHGYAQYLIPAVLVIILFQTLLLAVGMTSPGVCRHPRSAVGVVLGRALMWCVVYGVLALWLLGCVPRLFDLPQMESWTTAWAVMTPFLLGSSLLGVALSQLFSDSEVAPIAVAFFSVGLVFLSGISYPLPLLPEPWHTLHYCIPASVATLAMVKCGSMGASVGDCATQIVALWIQCVAYGAVAVEVVKMRRRRG